MTCRVDAVTVGSGSEIRPMPIHCPSGRTKNSSLWLAPTVSAAQISCLQEFASFGRWFLKVWNTSQVLHGSSMTSSEPASYC